jgi:hypothetical protein
LAELRHDSLDLLLVAVPDASQLRSQRAKGDQAETLPSPTSASSRRRLEERARGGRLEVRQRQGNRVALDLVGFDKSTIGDDGEVLDAFGLKVLALR